MTEKARGGRGKKVEKKYDRFTATLAPDLMQLLDSHAQARNLNRSEMLGKMVEHYGKARPLKVLKEQVQTDMIGNSNNPTD